jgi:glycosyltransferase involved in cell wall biosynthesis
VRLLRQQSTPNFRLLVVDNASPVAAEVALRDELVNFPAREVRLVRNRFNVGGDANILKCFELCETEYLWILGDDDEPLPDAVETVLSRIGDHPETLFYNFAHEPDPRPKESISDNVDEFIGSIDSYANILFISTSVFRVPNLTPYLGQGFRFAYSMAPHLVLLFQAMQNRRGKCVLLTDRIVRWVPTQEGTTWSVVAQMLGLGILLDLPLSRTSRKRLGQLVLGPRPLERVTAQLLGLSATRARSESAGHHLDQVYGRLLRYSGSWTMWIRYMVYRYCLLPFPTATFTVLRQIVARTGRGGYLVQFHDPFE